MEEISTQDISAIVADYVVEAEKAIKKAFADASKVIKETLGENANKDQEYINDLVSYYKDYLTTGIKLGTIDLKNITLFRVKQVKLEAGTAYARWGTNTLTIICPRFFTERNKEEQRNVIYHELSHAIVNSLIGDVKTTDGVSFSGKLEGFLMREADDTLISWIFSEYKNTNIIDIERVAGSGTSLYSFKDAKYEGLIDGKALLFQFINEATTQTIAEIFSYYHSGEKTREYVPFQSKIFDDSVMLKSNFMSYPEYQQLFLAFLRTINGLGQFDSDEELFSNYYEMLKSGEIWNRILCTYQEKGNLEMLYQTLILFHVIRVAKEGSMGVGVTFNGNKEKLTQIVNEMYQQLLAQRNYDLFQDYPLNEYEPWCNGIDTNLKFTSKRKPS